MPSQAIHNCQCAYRNGLDIHRNEFKSNPVDHSCRLLGSADFGLLVQFCGYWSKKNEDIIIHCTYKTFELLKIKMLFYGIYDGV